MQSQKCTSNNVGRKGILSADFDRPTRLAMCKKRFVYLRDITNVDIGEKWRVSVIDRRLSARPAPASAIPD